jgi:micrococcal nuclease
VTTVIRRTLRIGLALGFLAGLAYALAKVLGARSHPTPDRGPASSEPWPRLTEEPTAPAPVTTAVAAPWVAPEGGVCPTSHPVKAKLASKIFHLPGMQNYERTHPDRCYCDAAAAEADGFRPAKR